MPLFVSIFAAALFLTGLLRRYALARSILDIPNERSSHSLPTPRGGGVAIVVSFMLALLIVALSGALPGHQLSAFAGAGGLIAALGFQDDRGHIQAGWRLLGHFAAAAWALYWLGIMPKLVVPGGLLDLRWAGYVLGALYLVWLLNLYNFMDGIDGIAGVEAITVCAGAAALGWLADTDPVLWILPLFLASAVAGFLVWNFPPARIFMGDAGSGFLGITLGILSLQAAIAKPVLLWAWVILLGVFIVDATVTLMRRLLRGLKPYEAHRSHAYQYTSRRLAAHKPVTIAVGLINIAWLFPWALAATMEWVEGIVAVAIAYVPLVLLAFRQKAGAPELQEI
jgi:Fuc2NAc and GlcNAc transferase